METSYTMDFFFFLISSCEYAQQDMDRLFSLDIHMMVLKLIFYSHYPRLSYIRSITWSGVEVSLLAMSETLGDWASVTPLGSVASVLRLYTINGALVDSAVTPSPVTALAFTSGPEGTAINVIATSMADGSIR